MDNHARATREPGGRGALKALGILLLLGLLAVVAAGVWVLYTLSPVSETAVPASEFEVMPGWGASRVARELETQGVVRNGRLFALYLRYAEADRRIGEGLYELSPSMRAEELARVLAGAGRARVVRVVIPEGFRAADIAERLEGAGFGSANTFLELIWNPGGLRLSYMPPDASLEGYLFPASYDLPTRSTPEEVLEIFLRRFNLEVTAEVSERIEAAELTVHEWVIMASIIQSEAGNDGEMPIISGVFFNRYDIGMRLQSDPTVAYGLNKRLNELSNAAGDFTMQADHAWNTYTRAGLPAGPISNPGRAALLATLEPQRTNEAGQEYFYFLHGRDGSFRPNLDLDGHNRDVQRYLR